MRSLCFFIVVVSVAMSACQNKPSSSEAKPVAQNMDTLVYRYKSVSKSTGPCKKEDDICAKVEFSYPVFETAHGDSLNRWVAQKLGEGYMDTMIHTDYEEVMQQFLTGYTDMLKSMPDYTIPWEYKKSITVDKQVPGYITMHISSYEFAGGAHPNQADTYFHYDVKANKEFAIDDLLVAGGDAKLKTIAEGIFRKEFKLSDDISLDSAGFFFDNGRFSLPVNYTFAQDGIRFHYNDYEIRSHAEGPYDLTVPYAQVKDLARPGSYLSGLIPVVQ